MVRYDTYGILIILLLTIYILFKASIFDIGEEIQQIQGMSSISHLVLGLRLNV